MTIPVERHETASSSRKRHRLFIADGDGATAVEFALVAPVFFLLIIGMIELSLVMMANAILQSAVGDAARTGITGNSPAGSSRTEAIEAAIDDLTGEILDPTRLQLDELVYPSFDSIGKPEPFTDQNGNGAYDTGEPFTDINGNGHWDADMGAAGLGGPGDIVLYRARYDWQLITPFIRNVFLPDGVIHLEATTAVRNEPFPPS
jgi:Flp pilus assembly pilin Flp